MESAENRVTEILEILETTYPRSRTALYYRNPLQILVATILSAQCTDVRVNQITPMLFDKYRSAEDFAKAKQPELEDEIRPTGFFRNKSKNIIGAAKRIVEEYHLGKIHLKESIPHQETTITMSIPIE